MTGRKKVLVVAADFKPLPGGVAEYAWQMARAFCAHDAETLVLAPRQPGAAKFDGESQLDIQRTRPALPSGRVRGLRRKLLKVLSLASLCAGMRRLCREFAPDIVYLPSMYPLGAFLPRLRPRLVTTFHGGEIFLHCRTSRFRKSNRKLLLRSCGRSIGILANSNYTARALAELGVDPGRITVTACGADRERFQNAPKTQDAKERLGLTGRKVVLTVGRLDERKGFDTVIRCLPALALEFPDVYYVAVGAGPMRARLEALVKELNVQKHVRLTGRVDDAQVVDYMAACDVFAMPNRATADGSVEGFGIVLLEANYCSKPVIAGRSGGAVDAVEHEKTGLLVDPHSLDEVRGALERLLGNPELAAEWGRRGRERVKRDFTWEAVAGRATEHVLALVD